MTWADRFDAGLLIKSLLEVVLRMFIKRWVQSVVWVRKEFFEARIPAAS